MMKETIIEDSELGCLIVRVNPRARSLVFRTKRAVSYTHLICLWIWNCVVL